MRLIEELVRRSIRGTLFLGQAFALASETETRERGSVGRTAIADPSVGGRLSPFPVAWPPGWVPGSLKRGRLLCFIDSDSATVALSGGTPPPPTTPRQSHSVKCSCHTWADEPVGTV